ncbi:outer membrane biogenesis protein BamB [Pirellulimonas nuda]|uniref:Outer membrane biogenesis protein BamB n=1 Tax=Pirellulimonas nuda TaxID=2528009 RepID=A0A518D5Z3_9BACT|nr:PQQ-binding-like beta-propeller repeat protein [Pirellulimonas nuda]QDU86892.1 outer membrane biogenesis protein BamB [Pirellulimonas nuda]
MLRLLLACALAAPLAANAASPGELTLLVMDPLAAPLSCPCVEGYAQRDYDQLGVYLAEKLDRPVKVVFAESFQKALERDDCDAIDIVVGKDSVARADAKALGMKVTALARLTGKDGSTTQTGLIVVRSADPAKKASDLKGYRILFGPAECSEKHAAPLALLESAGVAVPPPAERETTSACSDGACKIIEWGDSERAAAVISSYAAPLLEGCGTIKKGDLRVVAETAPVPFVTALASDRLDAAQQERLRTALLDMASDPKLIIALETLTGFVPIEEHATQTKSEPQASADWPQFMGPDRNGRAPWLPDRLPESPPIVWQQPLLRSGLGGLAATQHHVVLGDRDAANAMDVFRSFEAGTGEPLWTVEYPAPGLLDYDNAPRATPLIADDKVYLLGAFGDLTCADLASGAVLWQTNLRRDFLAEEELVWGTCSSPLLVGDMLIVHTGATQFNLVALEAETGLLVWQAAGAGLAYASICEATFAGVHQVIAYDKTSLRGFDPDSGAELWRLDPPQPGDFNVPTPQQLGDRLLVVTENNGARLYDFDETGRIVPEPAAQTMALRSDTATPIVAAGRVFGAADKLLCLDPAAGFKTLYQGRDRAVRGFAPMLATDDRLLILGHGGELLLVDPRSDKLNVLSRARLFEDSEQADLYCYPALVGTRLFVRGERSVVCVELGDGVNHRVTESTETDVRGTADGRG